MSRIFGLHRELIKDVLIKISFSYKEKKNFIDIGCGDGTRTIMFQEFDRIVYGVDRKNWLKEVFRNEIIYSEEDFIESRLSYKSEFFDLIFSFDVIEHLPSPEVMLKEIYRLLKHDGVFIISTPNRHRFFNFFLLLSGLRKPLCSPKKGTVVLDPYSVHVKEYTNMEFEKLLYQKGFKVVKKHLLFYGITGWYGFPFFFNMPFFHNIIFECRKIR